MSNPGGFIGSGVGGGIQWDKNSDLEWRLNQMQQDMKFMWSRLDELERNRDENSEHYEAMESFKDAGEPVDRYIDPYFRSVIEENARLIENNDVLRYQYEAMKNETVRCKAQIERLRQTLQLIVDHPAGPVGKAEYWEIGAKDMIWLAAKALEEGK